MVARRTNRVAPAPLREPRRQRLVRQRFENQRQAPEVGQLPRKRMFCGNLTVLRVCCWHPWRPRQVFFACRGRSPLASGRRALGWNLRKSQSRPRSGFERSFPRPGKGNSASRESCRYFKTLQTAHAALFREIFFKAPGKKKMDERPVGRRAPFAGETSAFPTRVRRCAGPAAGRSRRSIRDRRR